MIAEVRRKIARLPNPRGHAVEPVLVTVSKPTQDLVNEGYFARILTLRDVFGAWSHPEASGWRLTLVMDKKQGAEEIRWGARLTTEDTIERVRSLVADGPDRRVRVWVQVRFKQSARKGKALAGKLDRMRKDLSSVESWPSPPVKAGLRRHFVSRLLTGLLGRSAYQSTHANLLQMALDGIRVVRAA